MSTSSGAPIQRTGTLLSLAEARIDLVDNAPSSLAATYDGGYDEDGTLQLVSTGAGLRQPRSNPIRHQLLKRKYAKHLEAKYKGSLDVARTNIDRLAVDTERSDREGSSTNLIEREASEAALTKAGKIKRGQKKVKGLIKNRRNKNNPANDGDSAVDVLYENQRGSFVFGMPLFSSQSLLNFDPAPWVNAYGHSSSVNITNAQLPDPSWQWVWHTWYVDMSQDVDEQGWQYSFMFQDKFSWHGTHPWLHSFVRRRRWLRKRVRSVHKSECRETYRLNASYFQVGEGRSSVLQGEQVDAMKPDRARDEDMTDILVDDIDDLPTLLHSLKTATVDREKITMVLAYMDKASADTHNFAEEIPHILSLFIYQNTRRQLLARMTSKIDAASSHRAEHQDRHEAESAAETERLDNLIRAAQAADGEIRKLEYWSDIREMVGKGESLGAVDADKGWGHGWEGVDRPLIGVGGADEEGEDEYQDEDEDEEDEQKVAPG